MPDGISRVQDPDRVWNLREFTHEMRKLVPRVVEMVDKMVDHQDQLTAVEQMALTTIVLDRAYGRPRTQLVVNEEPNNRSVRL